jgi:hypothetical protein
VKYDQNAQINLALATKSDLVGDADKTLKDITLIIEQ